MLSDKERIRRLVLAPTGSPEFKQALKEHEEIWRNRRGAENSENSDTE
jgi:hypothetical protein